MPCFLRFLTRNGFTGTLWLIEASNKTELVKREATDFLRYKNAKNLFGDFHSLRHTFITNLCKADVPPKTAQTLARHSDISLTINIYTHVDQAEQVKAIDALPGPQSATAMRL